MIRSRLHIHPDYAALLRDGGLTGFESFMATPGHRALEKPGMQGWRRRLELRIGGQTFFLKRYTRPPVAQQLRQRLAGDPATAAVTRDRLARAAEAGIPVPPLVAFGARTCFGYELASFEITRRVPGDALERWVRTEQAAGLLADPAFRQRLIRAVADLVARFHAAGLIHRDLYLSHIFLDTDRLPETHLSLIDLQRVMRPRLRRRRWIVKDIASLDYSAPPEALSRTDRLRWYRWYRGVDRLAPADRSLIHAVRAKVTRIARHSRKHQLG